MNTAGKRASCHIASEYLLSVLGDLPLRAGRRATSGRYRADFTSSRLFISRQYITIALAEAIYFDADEFQNSTATCAATSRQERHDIFGRFSAGGHAR